jgi:SAM-dependent methyltransferase
MNKRHLEVLSSPLWARMLEQDLLPWVTANVALGDDVLEIGPGPGLTTDLIRQMTPQLTAVEIDTALAEQLAARVMGTNVQVLNADLLDTDFAVGRFSAVVCFGVLHNVPSVALQDDIFREIFRVLRPGAPMAGSDGYDNMSTRQSHHDDVFVPVNPDELPDRLAAFGFTDVDIDQGEYDFRFRARKAH